MGSVAMVVRMRTNAWCRGDSALSSRGDPGCPGATIRGMTASEDTPRDRLLAALARVVAERGLAGATVAEVVRQAGVSKRTFYEHFTDRDDGFLALHQLASDAALQTLRRAVDPAQPWQDQVERALGAYFAHLAAGPALLRALFVDIHHLGEPGARARRRVMDALATFMRDTVNRGRPAAQPLEPAVAVAAVGAITELVLLAIERNEQADLVGLVPVASAIVRRLAQV